MSLVTQLTKLAYMYIYGWIVKVRGLQPLHLTHPALFRWKGVFWSGLKISLGHVPWAMQEESLALTSLVAEESGPSIWKANYYDAERQAHVRIKVRLSLYDMTIAVQCIMYSPFRSPLRLANGTGLVES